MEEDVRSKCRTRVHQVPTVLYKQENKDITYTISTPCTWSRHLAHRLFLYFCKALITSSMFFISIVCVSKSHCISHPFLNDLFSRPARSLGFRELLDSDSLLHNLLFALPVSPSLSSPPYL